MWDVWDKPNQLPDMNPTDLTFYYLKTEGKRMNAGAKTGSKGAV